MEERPSKNWIVKVSSQAQRYLQKLTPSTKKAVIEALREMSKMANPLDRGDIRPLIGPLRGSYRLRIGNHRVIFELWPEDRIIAVGIIKPRGDTYK